MTWGIGALIGPAIVGPLFDNTGTYRSNSFITIPSHFIEVITNFSLNKAQLFDCWLYEFGRGSFPSGHQLPFVKEEFIIDGGSSLIKKNVKCLLLSVNKIIAVFRKVARKTGEKLDSMDSKESSTFYI